MSKSLIHTATIGATVGALSMFALASGPASAASESLSAQSALTSSAEASASDLVLNHGLGGFAWIC